MVRAKKKVTKKVSGGGAKDIEEAKENMAFMAWLDPYMKSRKLMSSV